jgi:hypothetical protein
MPGRMTSSPIFIVGCPRSGTTLLRNLLRSHPRLTFPSESHFIPWFYRAYGHPRTERDAVALATRILRLQWIRQWHIRVEPGEFAPDRTFQAVIHRLFGAYTRIEDKPRWGDKTPHYVEAIPVLADLFPAGRIIHIIRDGRDVALSWLKAGFEPRNLFTAATLWKRYVSAGRRDGAQLPPATYLEVRYEALIDRPDVTMQTVCAFIAEPYTEAVLRPSPIRGILRPKIIGGGVPEAASRLERIAPSAVDWTTEMPPADRLLFESIAGDVLESLGYDVSGVRRSLSAGERLAWGLHHRLWWVLERLNTKGSHRWLLAHLELRRAVARARTRQVAPPDSSQPT